MKYLLGVSVTFKSQLFCHNLGHCLRNAERSDHQQDKVNILGIIENMSYFQCPSDGKIYHIFGEGGGEREAAKLGVPLLGKIPLDISTRSGGDEGRPVALEDPGQNPVSAAFRQVAEQCARVVLDR